MTLPLTLLVAFLLACLIGRKGIAIFIATVFWVLVLFGVIGRAHASTGSPCQFDPLPPSAIQGCALDIYPGLRFGVGLSGP